VKRRVVLITEIIAPYRIPVFNALAAREDIDLHVIFLSETDPTLRQWLVHKDEIRFTYDVLPSLRRRVGKYNVLLNRGLSEVLRRTRPEVVICGGYNYVASWQAVRWTNRKQVPFILWTESTSLDQRAHHAITERLKRWFLSRCQAFIVPGLSSRKYLRQLEIPDRSIFTAPNAMDLQLFTEVARRAKLSPAKIRQEFRLPNRYFLNVGRLVRIKGVIELLEAYAHLDPVVREKIGLVLVGDGELRVELSQRAARIQPGNIGLPGFLQKDRLPEVYALADAFIFPSLSDPWGFVVNEAMACGLPVIATDVAGCVADLVCDGENGLVVPARDVDVLSSAMMRLATDDDLRVRMSDCSARRILDYSPTAWAQGVSKAVQAVITDQGC
jgi:glycosyltransferase involved in cell wall biosynthesis